MITYEQLKQINDTNKKNIYLAKLKIVEVKGNKVLLSNKAKVEIASLVRAIASGQGVVTNLSMMSQQVDSLNNTKKEETAKQSKVSNKKQEFTPIESLPVERRITTNFLEDLYSLRFENSNLNPYKCDVDFEYINNRGYYVKLYFKNCSAEKALAYTKKFAKPYKIASYGSRENIGVKEIGKMIGDEVCVYFMPQPIVGKQGLQLTFTSSYKGLEIVSEYHMSSVLKERGRMPAYNYRMENCKCNVDTEYIVPYNTYMVVGDDYLYKYAYIDERLKGKTNVVLNQYHFVLPKESSGWITKLVFQNI